MLGRPPNQNVETGGQALQKGPPCTLVAAGTLVLTVETLGFICTVNLGIGEHTLPGLRADPVGLGLCAKHT